MHGVVGAKGEIYKLIVMCHLFFAYPTKNLDLQFSNFNLKFNCILIDYNDHVNDLAKNVQTNICYVHKSNFGELRYKGISNI